MTFLNAESHCDDNTKVIEDFISFPESPSLLFLDGYCMNYEQNN
jgi:hypothetical protein